MDDNHELNEAEGRALFDKASRRLLGISGDDFVRLYNLGAFDFGGDLHGTFTHLAMLLPFYLPEVPDELAS